MIITDNIATLIKKGFVKEAANKLGFYYSLSGIVSEGNKFGRTLGYPTANICTTEIKLVPAQGVYAAYVRAGGSLYKAMVNIGVRPTLSLENEIIEAHLLGFEGNLYNQKTTVFFVDYVRKEMKFPDTEALKKQLDKDKCTIENILNSIEISENSEGQLLI